MKHKLLSLIMAALVAVAPLFGQSNKDKNDETAEPATGVRFVNCSPAGVVLPTPLYYRTGKTVKELRITSRMPSSRVKPVGGMIALYDQDPSTSTEKKSTSAQKEEEIQPVINLEVPSDMATGKVLCILVPTDKANPYKIKPMFVKESVFPKNGVHIINFSSSPLQMKLSAKGDYSDAVISKIGAYKGGISKENSWSSPAGNDGQQFSFILSAAVKGSKDLRRIKASRFSVSAQQSQINIVIKDPEKEMFKLLSIQLNDRTPSR